MVESAAPIALRTRRSQADARVTLFSLEGAAAAAESPPESKPDVSSSSPATRKARNGRAKAEDDSAGESPVTPRKRARKTKVKDEGESEEDDEKKARRPSMSPRKPTPTKLRAKLEVAHPEPPRWRETYEIVSGFARKLAIQLICVGQIREQRKGIVAAVDLVRLPR